MGEAAPLCEATTAGSTSVAAPDSQPVWWRPFSDATSLVEQAARTVAVCGSERCLTWLGADGREECALSFDEVWRRSAALARALLQQWGVARDDRVLLCYAPGPEFCMAFWACLRAGVIAVPVYPPDPSKMQKAIDKLALVRDSCGARLCLCDSAVQLLRFTTGLLTHTWPSRLEWRCTEGSSVVSRLLGALRGGVSADGAGDANLDAPAPGDLAFLQFTSGSTGDPKGVMISHASLWHNINNIYLPAQRRSTERRLGAAAAAVLYDFDQTAHRVVGVSWLPQFHDTGLVLMLVAPFVAGYHMVSFSPLTFLSDPLVWPRALSDYGAHWTAAPDFAYELAYKRAAAENGRGAPYDLSTVVFLACGAGQRCAPPQLRRFGELFGARHGLRVDRNPFIPNYGLAEHVVATCGEDDGLIASRHRPELVSTGSHFLATIRVVDGETRAEMCEGEPGEIWISLRSVARGYWGKPELSAHTFGARLAYDDGRRYLRTGDEGFFEDGRLFICGRLKDLIICGGALQIVPPGLLLARALEPPNVRFFYQSCRDTPQARTITPRTWSSRCRRRAATRSDRDASRRSQSTPTPASTSSSSTSAVRPPCRGLTRSPARCAPPSRATSASRRASSSRSRSGPSPRRPPARLDGARRAPRSKRARCKSCTSGATSRRR